MVACVPRRGRRDTPRALATTLRQRPFERSENAGVISPEIRRAKPQEARELTRLALRSKAYWGYSEDFLVACRAELTVTKAQIKDDRVAVAMDADELVGFYSLMGAPPSGEVGAFFVDAPHIGRGVGRALFTHLAATTRAAGFASLRIEADPHAVGFYEQQGAELVGEAASGSIPGRALPVLELKLGERLSTSDSS